MERCTIWFMHRCSASRCKYNIEPNDINKLHAYIAYVKMQFNQRNDFRFPLFGKSLVLFYLFVYIYFFSFHSFELTLYYQFGMDYNPIELFH